MTIDNVAIFHQFVLSVFRTIYLSVAELEPVVRHHQRSSNLVGSLSFRISATDRYLGGECVRGVGGVSRGVVLFSLLTRATHGTGQAALCFPLIYVLGEPELWSVFYGWLLKHFASCDSLMDYDSYGLPLNELFVRRPHPYA